MALCRSWSLFDARRHLRHTQGLVTFVSGGKGRATEEAISVCIAHPSCEVLGPMVFAQIAHIKLDHLFRFRVLCKHDTWSNGAPTLR